MYNERMTIYRQTGAPSATALTSLDSAGRWVVGPGRLWGGVGAPSIPSATATTPGASAGDWYLRTDSPHIYQLQGGAWAQVV